MSRRNSAARAIRKATSATPAAPANPSVLSREFFGSHIPTDEQYRTHYGRSLDLTRIDYALRSANCGYMRPMTDLARETVSLDGHLSALLQKRLNRVAALDWDVQAAAGPGIDQGKAEDYAAFVRWQLELIPNFRERIMDLAWGNFDGRAASEIEWQAVGREWHARDIHWIHPRRLSFGPNRDLRVVDSHHDGGGFRNIGFPLEQVPHKFIVYRPRIFGDYQEREGLAPRALYWSFFCRFGTRERMALLELFGKPWRIVMPKGDMPHNVESLNDAFNQIKNLSGQSAARLPPGFDVMITQPTQGAGQVHDQAIDHAMKVLSKLFLGSTGTTDAVSTGLGSSIGDAHLSEEDLLIASDARRGGEALETSLTDSIIAVNFGPSAVRHAPLFILRTEPPMDREKEGTRIGKALEIGLQVSLEEAREKLGVSELKEGEPYLQRVQRSAEFGMVAPPPAPEIIYPAGMAPPPGELGETPQPAINLPGDGGGDNPPRPPPPSGSIPPGGGTPPPALPPGAANDVAASDNMADDAAGNLAAKMTELGIARCEHGKSNRCRICGIERVRDVEMVDGVPVWGVAWRPIHPSNQPSLSDSKGGWLTLLAHKLPNLSTAEMESIAEAPVDELRRMVLAAGGGSGDPGVAFDHLEAFGAANDDDDDGESWAELSSTHTHDGHICLAEQPSTVFGSPEVMVDRGTREFLTVTSTFADSIVDAVSGKTTAKGIRASIDAAAKRFGTDELAEPVYRELFHGGMLGSLDADFEMEENTSIAVESFTAFHAELMLADPTRDKSFATRPLKDAIAKFLEREVVTKDVFDSMEKAAQRRAFTVARLANKEMVRTVKRELVRQIAIGADLAEFGKHAAARFKSAGWVPANSSHVETIFRTNVLNSYNGGRVRQMSQPDVLDVRPFWQILTANDGPPRQRGTHRAVHGVVLRANDPFWKEAAPPFGYNCRCRIRSLSIRQGAPKVMDGRSLRGLPDPGFTSGIGLLL